MEWIRGAVVAAAALAVAGCSGASEETDRPAGESLVVGFLYVGSVNDQGYNEAAHEGSRAVRRAFPGARVLQAEDVPETRAAEDVMQDQIDRGATIIFPTSFGHLDAALNVAGRNPDVTFLHQGGLTTAPNLGTYFGTIWEAEYAAGQAAGLATRSDRLGFVAAFPIAQSLLTVNAFQLGAQSVNPRVRTRIVFTGEWCDAARQRNSARSLLRWGADVLSQHQDCTATVIRTAAAAGAKVTGYHYDARDIAPEAWLTGAEWRWGPLLVDMVRTVIEGRFAESAYSGRYRAGAREGVVRLASFGPSVSPSARRRVRSTFSQLRSGELEPFAGPVRDQAGRVRIQGRQPTVSVLEETDYLVEGVVGRLEEPG